MSFKQQVFCRATADGGLHSPPTPPGFDPDYVDFTPLSLFVVQGENATIFYKLTCSDHSIALINRFS